MSINPYYKNKEGKIVYFAGMTTCNWITIAWVCSQNGYETNFDNFDFDSVQKIAILPFDELPKIELKDLLVALDNQRMETLNNQINYYHTFLKI